jgi:cytosine/adenosine deaminase-related metal-dependent hydrolase
MSTLLVKNAAFVVTMDDDRQEISDGGLYIQNNIIEQVGKSADLPSSADTVLNLSGHVVIPGLVNTHHHMYQTLTRVLAQDEPLFGWLKTLYPIWAHLRDEGIYISTLTALAELALSGCTTSSDHLYIFPNDCTLDSQIRAAQEIGVRFHAARGSMSLGESKGGLPPDSVTENEQAILKDSQRLIESYHDHHRHAMMRIVLAPCSPFSVTPDLMRESAELARQYNVRLHTHLAETYDEEVFCLETFGKRPAWYAESLGWTGDDVWHAHCIHLNQPEIMLFGNTRTGVAHCPGSNMRLGSGIAPITELIHNGVDVGLGVDGSASNDGNHLLAEARLAMLLQRVGPVAQDETILERTTEGGIGRRLPPLPGDPTAMSARQALEISTRGGAAVLGRDDIGHLSPGMSADFVSYNMNNLSYAGAQKDLVSALLFCQPQQVDLSVIDGRIVVQEGRLTTLEIEPVIERHNELSADMIRGE